MADLRPQYSEEVVGANHPTKTDVANRAWNVEHDVDGTHKLPIPPGTEMVFIQNAAPTGWTRNAARQDNAMLCYAAAGNLASGGGVNPQSTHTHTGPNHTHGVGSFAGPSHTHTGPSHTHTTGSHALSIAELAAHTHTVGTTVTGGSGTGASTNTVTSTFNSGSTGSGTAHNHGATGADGTGATGANTAPYFQEVISCIKD